ncbi:MAG: hypothetical protein EBZ48_15360 [Proteobacteria bacterium]|nr:hypothetical protein [Pseudomonadota bacterium]
MVSDAGVTVGVTVGVDVCVGVGVPVGVKVGVDVRVGVGVPVGVTVGSWADLSVLGDGVFVGEGVPVGVVLGITAGVKVGEGSEFGGNSSPPGVEGGAGVRVGSGNVGTIPVTVQRLQTFMTTAKYLRSERGSSEGFFTTRTTSRFFTVRATATCHTTLAPLFACKHPIGLRTGMYTTLFGGGAPRAWASPLSAVAKSRATNRQEVSESRCTNIHPRIGPTTKSAGASLVPITSLLSACLVIATPL